MSTRNGRMESPRTPLNITDDTTIDELLEEIDLLLSSFKNHVRIMKIRNHLTNLHNMKEISRQLYELTCELHQKSLDERDSSLGLELAY